MSYYSYKKKLWLETSKKDLLPLALYADSSIRERDGGFVWNWCVYNLGLGGILINKEKFKEKAEEEYQNEIELLTNYELKYNGKTKPDIGPESYSYYGTKYPSGGKLKNMKSFHSVKNTIPLDEFLQNPENHFTVGISAYDTKNYRTVYKESVLIVDEQTAYDTQRIYERIKKEYPQCGVCLGVYGVYGLYI